MASGTGIGEFFISIGVDAADGVLTVGNLLQQFGALEIAGVAEIAILYEMAVLLARVTDEGIKASLGFEQFTMHTGLSAQELQKWQIVAEQSHASAQDVTGSVENLTKKLANMAIGGTGGGALGALQQLFISPFGPDGKPKKAFDLLDEIRHRLGIIKDTAQQERIIGDLGISPNLLETLLLTDARFKGLADTAHGMTSAQEKSFDAMRQHFVGIHLIAQDIGRDIGAWVADLDRATGALKTVEGFMRGVRDVVEGKALIIKPTPAQAKADEQERAFFRSVFNPNPQDLTARQQLEGLFPRLFGGAGVPLPPEPAGGFRAAPGQVTIDKHDTYIIHDAHDPKKVQDVIEKSWDETLKRKTIDGFDRQTGNGGY